MAAAKSSPSAWRIAIVQLRLDAHGAARNVRARHAAFVRAQRLHDRRRVASPPGAAQVDEAIAPRNHVRQHEPERPEKRAQPAGAMRPVAQRLLVPGVAAEELVAAVAREGDRHRLPRELGHQEVGYRGRVRDGLVEHRGDRVEDLLDPGMQHQLRVVGAERGRDRARRRGFVELLFGESDREGPHAPRGVAAHQRDDGRRIQAARQERAQRHLGFQVRGDSGVELRAQRLDQLRLVRRERARDAERSSTCAPARPSARSTAADDLAAACVRPRRCWRDRAHSRRRGTA